MKRVSIYLILSAVVILPVRAQKKQSESFSEFRTRIMNDYNKFRNNILEDYDKFLEGVWDQYQSMRGTERKEYPKPRKAPRVAPEDLETRPSEILPTPATDNDVEPEVISTTPKGRIPKPPVSAPLPVPVPDKEMESFIFPFYGMDIRITDAKFNVDGRLATAGDFARQWRTLSKDKAETLIPGIRSLSDSYGLNDYLTFRLIRDYVKARYPKAHVTSRTALEHYLLANMGYDVRIALDERGIPLLLISSAQQLFWRPYMMVGNGRYYVFPPDGEKLHDGTSISTYRLPADSEIGRPMDFRLGELNLPEKPVAFDLSYGDISLAGTVNENLMKVVYDYPNMPIGDYAVSVLSPALREDLVGQLKGQLAGMKEREAVDKLLQFTQNAFEYATDEEFHGFEKPYFLEEILYYPKCDCEDRSIFYTYMLWNVLGLENHLLAYPGHESAAVRLSEAVEGVNYKWNDGTYYISDPTYIGSVTGMCMPLYRKTVPEIDHAYRNK